MRIAKDKLILRFNLVDILATYCIVWAVSPVIQYGTLFRLLAVFCAGLWLFYTAYLSIELKLKSANVTISVIVYIVGIIFLAVLTGSNIMSAIIQRLHMMIFLLFLCMGTFYAEKRPEFLKTAMKISIVLLTIFCLTTYREYQITPGISRMLVYEESIGAAYARRGVGGYGLIYSSVGCMAAILYNILTVKTKQRYLYLIPAAVMSVTIASSGYLIATMLLACEYFFFIFKLHKQKNIKITILILLIIVAVIYIFVTKVLVNNTHIILNIFKGTLYEVKSKEIVHYLLTDEMSGHLDGRVDRYGRSFAAAIKHFVFGALVTDNMEDVAGHSTLLDVLGTYGIIFSWGYYYAIIYAIKKFADITTNKGFVILMILVIVFNGVFDTFTGEMGVAYFIVFPAMLLTIKDELEKPEND